MKTVAFIGLGHMGLPMAANLVKAGYAVRGHDLSEVLRRAAAKRRAFPLLRVLPRPSKPLDVIITMLPKGEHVVSVYGSGSENPCRNASSSTARRWIWKSALKAHELAASAGCPSVDAPVSGGTGGCRLHPDLHVRRRGCGLLCGKAGAGGDGQKDRALRQGR